MVNILIYARPETVEHKMADKLPEKPRQYCFWTGRQPANDKDDKIDMVCFSDGKRIFAEGKYIIRGQMGKCGAQQSVAFWFQPLKRVNKQQPRKPPTRGWCYV